MDKHALLRVIKQKQGVPGGQEQHIKRYDEDWDGDEVKGKESVKKGGGEKGKKKKQKKEAKYQYLEQKAKEVPHFFASKPEPLPIEEWYALVEGTKDIKTVSKERMRQSIVEGIPISIRGDIWCLLCDFESEQTSHDPGLYEKLLEMENQPAEYMISRDIYRTLPETQLFSKDYKTGENPLYNVLKAYSSYDNKIGYVQGMNYLAALLLIEIKDEIRVFWCLFCLLFKRNWRMIFDHNTPKLLNLLALINDRL
jgi:hypothetical protein